MKKLIHGLMLRIYGEDEENVNRKVQEQRKRIEERKAMREKAGVWTTASIPTSEDYSDWLNLGEEEK